MNPALRKQFGERLSGAAQRRFRRPIGGFGFVLGWMALCGLILFLQRFHAVTTISFQIAVREAAAIDGLVPCFYYDTGRGFSESEKTCFEYNLRPVNQFQTYQVILPTRTTVRRVRFHPLREDGVVTLRQLAVGRYRYLFTPVRFRVKEIHLEREFGHTLYPLHESRLSIKDESLVAQLSTRDPYFMLSDRLDRQTAIDAGPFSEPEPSRSSFASASWL